MNILFVTNNYKPYGAGLVSSLESFRHELRRQGHQVTLVTLDFTGTGSQEPGVIRLRCPLRFKFKSNPIAIPFFVKKQLGKIFDALHPDVVHVHHPFGLGYYATQCARKRKIPVFFTHHTQYGQYARHYVSFLPIVAEVFVNRYVTRFCQFVDAIVAPTESIKRELLQTVFNKPIKVIPSGVLPIFTCTELPQKKSSAKIFSLLTVSRFVLEKNIPFLLQVMAKLGPEFSLTLVGYGEQHEALQNYAFDILGLSRERILFVHKPPKIIIAQFYRDADLFIFASKTETQGIVFAESMASGTPIVAVRAPGAQDCVKEGVNGFLVDSVDEMVEKIIHLHQNRFLLEELREGSWQESHHFQPEQLSQELVQLYQEIVERQTSL